MYIVIAVANEILRQGKKKDIRMSPMKLVKITYIAHGFHLAIFDRKLFPEQVQAWKYGPVIPDLYHATKKFKKEDIPFDIISLDSPGLSDKTDDFLEDVVSKYGKLTASALSSLTHQAGSPWDQVCKSGHLGIEIPSNLIKEHYQRIMRDYHESLSASPS